MTSNQQSTVRHTKHTDPEGYAAAITSLARCRRSVRKVEEASTRYVSVETAGTIERRGAVFGPLTAEQSEFEDDMQAEIARQDANPEAYIIRYTPEQFSEAFNVPVELCRGLGTES